MTSAISEPISLVTEESGVRTEHKPDEFVKSSHFECLGHIPSGAVDLYWSLFSREMKMETNITRDLSNNDFIATVHDNYLTLTILGRFVGTVSCKSRASSDEIRVDVLTTGRCIHNEYTVYLLYTVYCILCTYYVYTCVLALPFIHFVTQSLSYWHACVHT